MSVNAREEEYQEVELFGKPALFTNSRIAPGTVPEGWFCYDLRGSDYDPGRPVTIEPRVVVNHAGTILVPEPVKFRKDQTFRRLRGGLNFVGGNVGLKEFCEAHGITYPEDNQKYRLRPASESEAGLFYAHSFAEEQKLGCVGNVRIDFGHKGQEFWHTWCVTKDDVSTIYLAIAHDGETRLDEGWQKNPRFAADTAINEAAERLQLSIAGLGNPSPTMTMGGLQL